MVDISASLSLTPSSLVLDPAAVMGAETADFQAFGNILADQIAVQPISHQSAATLDLAAASLPLPAGNRQPGGNILPGAAAVLPDAAVIAPERVLPEAAIPALAVRVVAPAAKAAAELSEAETAEAAPAKPAEAAPVHTLIKMLAQAVRGPRGAAKDTAEPEAPVAAADDAAPAAADTASVQADLSALAIFAAAPQSAAPQFVAAQAKDGPGPAGGLPEAKPVEIAIQAPPAAAARPVQAEPAPVLTVAAEAGEAPVPAVTLVQSPVVPVGQAVTARVKVAAPEAKPAQGATPPPFAAADAAPAAERAAPVARAVAAERSPVAERILPELTTPVIADGAVQAAPATAAAPAVATAPTVELPRHDFAALVDRLIEARNASSVQSTQATVNHAEFGQVSLNFQQDGKDLSVSMSAADPEFARAVQAAMPAERQNMNADTNSRGQSQSQAQSQAQSNTSSSHHEAAGQRGAEAGDQQGRGNRGNQRGGANSSNPSRTWAEGNQPQTRGGIFA